MGMCMFFLSHAWSDNEIADPVASRFIREFGEDEVWYDRWNLQPGDSITGGMSEGLERSQIVFLLFSKAALERAMAKREWQSSLSRAIKGKTKLVLVRLEEIEPPAIMDDLVYIDMFSLGYEQAVKQMIAVCRGDKAFDVPQAEGFQNLVGKVIESSPSTITVEVVARRFSVPQPTICVEIRGWGVDDFDVHPAQDEPVHRAGEFGVMSPDGAKKLRLRYVTLFRPIAPGRSLVLDIALRRQNPGGPCFSLYHRVGDDFIQLPPDTA